MEHTEHFPLLRKRTETRFGRAVHNSLDFKNLSCDILQRTGESLSASTLKRFWGYVSASSQLSRSSLDILARYVGFSNFAAFCSGDASLYLDAESVPARSIPKGAEVEVCWNPGRRLRLLHLGEGTFRVVAVERSKLHVGDCFELASFIVGFPLYLGRVFRDEKELPAYVAGATGGLSSFRILTPKQ